MIAKLNVQSLFIPDHRICGVRQEVFMNKKIILFVLADQFADWEGGYLAANLNDPESGAGLTHEVKTLGVTSDHVRSMGGFLVKTDYTLQNPPEDFSGLVLVGGNSWRKPETAPVADLVASALEKKVPVGAICDATVFLGMHGYLNRVEHTSNSLNSLQCAAGDAYTNSKAYVQEDAVRDGLIVTANGQSPVEFGREMLRALGLYDEDQIQMWYDFNKLGLMTAMQKYCLNE